MLKIWKEASPGRAPRGSIRDFSRSLDSARAFRDGYYAPGNLDSRSGLEIMALLERLNRKGKTILMVTHSRELAKHTERIIHLLDGQIIRDEEVKERKPATSELVLEAG